jgi:hypothetical protein
LSVNDKEGKRSVNASVSTFGVSPATPTPSSYMAGLAQAVTTSSTSIGTSIQRDYVPPQVRETNNASSNTAAANASSSVRFCWGCFQHSSNQPSSSRQYFISRERSCWGCLQHYNNQSSSSGQCFVLGERFSVLYEQSIRRQIKQ